MTVRGRRVPRAARTTALAGALAVALAGPLAAPAATADTAGTDPSPSASPDASSPGAPAADPERMEKARAAVAEEDAAVAAVEVTDPMRADATFDLRADDATFALDAADATTSLETTREQEEDTVVTLTSDLLFDFGKATLTPQAKAAVSDLAADVPQDATVRVDGYTDSVGTEAKNLALSKKRAKAVADVLGAERPDLELKVRGHGEKDPVADNEVNGEDNPAGRALNRRVEVTYPTA